VAKREAAISGGARLDRVEVGADPPPTRHKVVVGLKSEEEAIGQSEISSEPQIRIGADGALAEDDFIDATRRHMERQRQRVLAERERLEKLLQQDFTGRRVRRQFGSVVTVDDFDMMGSSFPPDETDAPLLIDADRMLACAIRFQSFQPIAGRRSQITQNTQLFRRKRLPMRPWL
jgi:hypothetical protein